jgi:hypothetical protein
MKKHFITILLILILAVSGFAQKPWEFGGEFMKSIGKGFIGNIAGARYESFKNKNSFSIGLTYHFSGKNSYSSSKGIGMYVGLRHGFGNDINSSNPFFGIRALFSFENFDGKTSLNSLMVTPIAEAGYHFLFGKSLYTAPVLGWGYTIKITKEYNSLDEDIGGRFLPGISAGFRF